MGAPEKSRIPEVDEPAEVLNPPTPSAVAPIAEYQSSEELQRRNRDTFVDKATEKAAKDQRTEKDKLHKVLDKHIAKHSKTTDVREMAKKNKRTAEYQLDLSADLVELLEKIKNELR